MRSRPWLPLDMSMASDGEPGRPMSTIEGSSAIMLGENPPSLFDLTVSITDMRLTAESRFSQALASSVCMSAMAVPNWNPLTVDMDENLECVVELTDDVYEERLLWLSENLCLRDSGLAESMGDSLCGTDRAAGCVVLVSSVRPSE